MGCKEKALKGKVAVITGAGRGIGKAIALAYAKAGTSVVIGARTLNEIDETAHEIQELGEKALAVQTDVTNLDSVNALFQRASDEFGGVDILVANAGVSLESETIEKSNPEIWREVIDINLIGAYHTVYAAIPYLKQRGSGKIITLGSGLGHRGTPGSSAYASSKAALWMLTRVLAQELWQHNISVNELIPGPVHTSLTSGTPKAGSVFGIDSEWKKQPEDVVPLALFLASQPDIGPSAQSFSLLRRDT